MPNNKLNKDIFRSKKYKNWQNIFNRNFHIFFFTILELCVKIHAYSRTIKK